MPYDDVWIHIENGSRVTGTMSSYYVCQARVPVNGGMCLTATTDKDWARETAAGQFKWYCPRCRSRYKASWGQVVVITRTDGNARTLEYFYMRAEVPPWTSKDGRALFHRYHKERGERTSEEDYERLLMDQPTLEDLMVETEIEEPSGERNLNEDNNVKKYKRIMSKESFDTMPLWTWEQIFNFVGKTSPPRKSARIAEPATVTNDDTKERLYSACTTTQTTSTATSETEQE